MKWFRHTCVLTLTLVNSYVFAADLGKLQSFRQEYVLQPAVLGALPEEISDAVASGNVEVRQQIRFDVAGNYLSVVTFPAMAGSPAMTPASALPCDPMEQFRVDLTSVTVSDGTISFVGTVAAGAKTLITKADDEDPFVLTTSFQTTGSTVVFRDISVTVEDQKLTGKGVGVLAFSNAAPQPPVVVATTDFTTTQPETQLDASASTDPNGGGQLDFYWHTAQGAAVLLGCRTATPTIQFAGGPGQYKFVVTATDAAGISIDQPVTVTYYGR